MRCCAGTSDFYPRSPCGERLVLVGVARHKLGISIHALLAESDGNGAGCTGRKLISIHALLAESDTVVLTLKITGGIFLSTLSLRRATTATAPPLVR